MREPLQEEMGCGLWNTNQRLIHQFGNHSALHFTESPLGGFRTEIVWEIPAQEEQPLPTNLQGDTANANDHC
ncbi:hypothetical protein D3C86_2082630 [compost metagenome]